MPTIPNTNTGRDNPQSSTRLCPVDIDDFRDWREHLLKDGEYSGHIHACSYNATYALRHAPEWKDVIRYDENSSNVVLASPIPFSSTQPSFYPPFPCPWRDLYSVMVANWLQSEKISVGKEIAWDAVQIVAESRKFHGIRDYLNGLEWDGVARIDTWLEQYLGVEPTAVNYEYIEAVGSKFLISGVARAMRPGCKVDTCLILEGPQGKLKSTALRSLSVNPAWFTDEIPSLLNKDSDIQLRGMWIVEFAELDAIKGAGWSRIKSWLSRRSDRYRPVHAKHAVDFPRQTVFSASVNHFNYLDDETGARRFWPVEIHDIRLDELVRDRDQLWAEAVTRYRAHDSWWLDARVSKLAQVEQESRFDADVWQENIGKWLESSRPNDLSSRVTTSGLLLHLGLKPAEWDKTNQMRVAKCLNSLGWKKMRESTGSRGYYFLPPSQD